MNPGIVSSRRLLAILSLAAVLAAGCQPKTREPRRLPFPTFRAEASFPEYQSEGGLARKGGAASQFKRDLNGGLGEAAPSEPEGQNVPLGSAMTGRIPSGEGWTWSIDGGATLITYAPGSGRPGALIYAESFSPEIHGHPAAEHLRFQVTVDPDLAEGYLGFTSAGRLLAGAPGLAGAHLSPGETARWLQLLSTRTLGRGLGFRATRGTFTGWRWVGRNPQGVTLRTGRHLGVWAAPRPLPPALAEALAGLRGAPAQPASQPVATGVSAYLILGSATDRDEETGVHLALLCVREPRCLVYQELSQFLASIQVAEGGLLERLRSAPPIPFQNMVQDSGLEIAPSAEMPDVSKLAGAPAGNAAPQPAQGQGTR
jgi:hypothetical protein